MNNNKLPAAGDKEEEEEVISPPLLPLFSTKRTKRRKLQAELKYK
jgi:hypothetical protein